MHERHARPQRTWRMHFMVIERFPKGVEAVGTRFRARGRQMPGDVHYVASWLTPKGDACYQVMEAPSRAALQPWIDAWSDLVDFEIQPVVPSAEFWAGRTPPEHQAPAE